MPPLPRLSLFATAPGPDVAAAASPAAAADATSSPLESNGDVHKLRISATATPTGCPLSSNSGFGHAKRPKSVAATAATAATEAAVAAPLSEPGGREKARKRESLEQLWAAWQQENNENGQENRGPAPILGKPAPAPAIIGPSQASLGRSGSGGGGARGGTRGWGGVGDFHDKVVFLGEYVASVFGRSRRGGVDANVSKTERCGDVAGVVQYGVE